MKLDLFSSPTLEAAEAYMSRLVQRQQIVASNLANIDTPGYKTKDISFYATMQELLGNDAETLQTSRDEHAGARMLITPRAQVFDVQGLTSRADQNNVDLDGELLKLSQTSFGYSLMSQIVRGKLRTIASSIAGGNV